MDFKKIKASKFKCVCFKLETIWLQYEQKFKTTENKLDLKINLKFLFFCIQFASEKKNKSVSKIFVKFNVEK